MANLNFLGNFANGFMTSWLARQNLEMNRQYYQTLNGYYTYLMRMNQFDPHTQMFWNSKDKKFNSPVPETESQSTFNRGYNAPQAGAADTGKYRAAYINAGMTPAGADAMIGNFGQETSYGTNTAGDIDPKTGQPTSFGGFQWHDDPSKNLTRGSEFMNWASRNKLDPKDPMTSIQYSIVELKGGYPELWKQLTTSNDTDGLTKLVMDKYEAPAPATAHLDTRIQDARKSGDGPVNIGGPGATPQTPIPPAPKITPTQTNAPQAALPGVGGSPSMVASNASPAYQPNWKLNPPLVVNPKSQPTPQSNVSPASPALPPPPLPPRPEQPPQPQQQAPDVTQGLATQNAATQSQSGQLLAGSLQGDQQYFARGGVVHLDNGGDPGGDSATGVGTDGPGGTSTTGSFGFGNQGFGNVGEAPGGVGANQGAPAGTSSVGTGNFGNMGGDTGVGPSGGYGVSAADSPGTGSAGGVSVGGMVGPAGSNNGVSGGQYGGTPGPSAYGNTTNAYGSNVSAPGGGFGNSVTALNSQNQVALNEAAGLYGSVAAMMNAALAHAESSVNTGQRGGTKGGVGGGGQSFGMGQFGNTISPGGIYGTSNANMGYPSAGPGHIGPGAVATAPFGQTGLAGTPAPAQAPTQAASPYGVAPSHPGVTNTSVAAMNAPHNVTVHAIGSGLSGGSGDTGGSTGGGYAHGPAVSPAGPPTPSGGRYASGGTVHKFYGGGGAYGGGGYGGGEFTSSGSVSPSYTADVPGPYYQGGWAGYQSGNLIGSALAANPALAPPAGTSMYAGDPNDPGYTYASAALGYGAAPASTPSYNSPAAPTQAPYTAPSSASLFLPALPTPATAQTAVNPSSIRYTAPTATTGLVPPPTTNSTVKNNTGLSSNANNSAAPKTQAYGTYNIGQQDQLISAENALSSAQGFDDGGTVSGSVAGMPPGIGGQAPIPPIYYNPATYAAAGAPVGRGVSATSAPSYVAAPVPTFARGGVVGLDAGGDPSQGMYDPAMMSAPTDDQTQQTDYQSAQGAVPAIPNEVAFNTSVQPFHRPIEMGRGPMGFPHAGGGGGAARMPRAPMPRSSGRGAIPQGEVGNPTEGLEEVTPQSNSSIGGGPPPGAPPWAPQVMDENGNWSHGLMGAVISGLHTLAQATGLTGPQGALQTDPMVQYERSNMVSGKSSMSDENMQKIYQRVDPGKSMDTVMRNLAGLEAVYNELHLQGEDDKAGQVAAAMLNYSKDMSSKYGTEAVKRWYHGDMDGVIDNLQKAEGWVPDGKKVLPTMNPDGSAHVVQSNLANVKEWETDVAPQELLRAAIGAQNGSLYWQRLEEAAYKHNPAYKTEMDEKTRQRKMQEVNAGIAQMQGVPLPGGQGGQPGQPPAPQQVRPAITPAVNTAPTGAAQASTPPVQPGNAGTPSPGDSNAAQGAIPPRMPQLGGDPDVNNELLRFHGQQQSEYNTQQREQETNAARLQEEQFRDITARRAEAWKQRSADTRDKAANRRAAQAPMGDKELQEVMGQADEVVKAAPPAIGRMIRGTQAFNRHMDPATISDTLQGLATGSVGYDQGKIKPIDDEWGTRYVVPFSRKDGSGGNITLSEPNFNYIRSARAAASQAGQPKQAPPAIPQPSMSQRFRAPTPPQVYQPIPGRPTQLRPALPQ
jgi:hypothetical protein